MRQLALVSSKVKRSLNTGKMKTYDRTQQWLRDWLENPDVLAVGVPFVIVSFFPKYHRRP